MRKDLLNLILEYLRDDLLVYTVSDGVAFAMHNATTLNVVILLNNNNNKMNNSNILRNVLDGVQVRLTALTFLCVSY